MNRSILTVLLFGFIATASAQEQFLEPGEISKLRHVAGLEGVSNYNPPGVDVTAYKKALIGGVTFFFAEKSKVKEIDADELKQISDALKGALSSALSPRFEMVTEPAPGVLQFNVAITDITMKNKKRGLFGYTPIGIVTTAAGNAAGMRVRLFGAQLQGEAVDAESGEVVGLFAIEKMGDFDEDKDLSWEDVRGTLEHTAKQIASLKFD